MKKYILALMVFAIMNTCAFASVKDANIQTGLLILDLPVISAVQKDTNNNVTGYTGLNGTLGLTHRSYFRPLKENSWNSSWEIGTLLLLLPYFGFGLDYNWDNGWYAGFGTLYIIPYPRAGVMF